MTSKRNGRPPVGGAVRQGQGRAGQPPLLHGAHGGLRMGVLALARLHLHHHHGAAIGIDGQEIDLVPSDAQVAGEDAVPAAQQMRLRGGFAAAGQLAPPDGPRVPKRV